MKLRIESIKNRLKSNLSDLLKRIEITHKLDYGKSDIYLHDNIRLASCKREPDTIRWIEDFKKDDIAFDVGANIGAYSLVMAKRIRKVYAFEPSVFTFNTLIKNIHTNKAVNIVPLNIALSQHKRLGTFVYSSTSLGSLMHRLDGNMEGSAYEQQILSYSIDELIDDFKIEPPQHIKIDVDGTEFEILKGAAKTISGEGFNSLIVEADAKNNEMFDYLKSLGFQKEAKYNIDDATRGNYLFTR
ncbi:MAG: FkbM family methyltransferase [Candidatus Omnitrophica bacterium]|nr:FkbM family methyltransferase [Candidatus Omnitrophota bacterium]